jgi:branched-chain amino acid transport system permease protein
MVWVNAVIQGVLLGGLYALFAAGLSLVFGVMRLVNLAHGDLSVLAAYGSLLLADHFSLNPWLSLIVVIPAMAFGGYVLQRLVLNATLDSNLAPLLATFGLAVIIQNSLLQGFSADSQRLQVGNVATSSIRITSQVSIGWFPLITLIAAVVVLVGLQLLLRFTSLGRALRATSDDQQAAQLVGIDNRRLYGIAMAISLATAALAGIFLGIRTIFAPSAGPVRLIFAFEAVIIGGLGSLWGTLVGGITLGVAQSVGAQFSPGWGVLTGHLVFLAVLLVRPTGLFPRTVTA